MSQMSNSTLRKNVTEAMGNITDAIKQGYQTVKNELSSAER